MKAQVSFTRGKALLEARKYQEARELLAEATVLYPTMMRRELSSPGPSISSVSSEGRSSRSRPRSVVSRRGRVSTTDRWSRLRLSRYHLAIAAFRPALERIPEYPDALNGLGSALFELAQYDAALPPLEDALRRSRPLIGAESPEAGTLRPKVAWSLYHLGRYREALAMFVRASLASPDSHQLHVGMGWCYIKLGQKGDARTAFQRALQLGPGDEAAREGFGASAADERAGRGTPASMPRGHRWQHTGPTALTCEISPRSRLGELSLVGFRECPLCSGREEVLVRDLHSHYCNMCEGDWDH